MEQQVASLGSAAKVGAVFGAAFAVAERAVGAVSDVLVGGARAVAEYSSRLQSSKVAWTQFTGSGEDAEALILRMQQIAAKTPFEFQDVERGTQRLVAMGFTLKETESVMMDAITVSSGFGKGVAGVDALTIALGQMNSSGHVYAQDMNQLIAVGVPAWRILADATGLSVEETRKQAEQGKITSDVMLAAFHAWAGSKFGDVVAQQSHTATGALSTIRDNLLATGARAFAPAMEGFTALANRIADFTSSPAFGVWASKVAAVLTVVIENVAALAGFFASGLGAVLTVVTGVGQAIYDALSWLNPFATHSPSLVSQVEDGVAVIMQAYSRLPGIGGPLGAAAGAVRAFAAAASDGMANYEATQDQATAKTTAIFGADVPAAYLAAKAAIGQLQQSLAPLQTAITAQEGVVASWEQAVKSSQATLDAEKQKLAGLEKQLGTLQQAYDDAKKRVDAFANTPLAGTKALADQLFAVEQQATGVQLAIAQWKVSPTTLASIKSAQDAVAAQQGVVDEWSARVAASEQAVKGQEAAVAAAEQAQIAYANAVKAAQGAIDAQKERIAAANATLGAQKDALAAAQKQLAEYGKAQLSGTQAFQDRLFALDMEVAAVQKRLIDLKLDPGLNAQIAATEGAIIAQTAAIADAERGMKGYDLAVEAAKIGLAQQQSVLSDNRAAVDAIASSLKKAQDAIKNFASTAITGTKAFEDRLFSLDQQALAVQKRLIDLKLDPGLNTQIAAAQSAIDAQAASIALAEGALKDYDAAVIAAKSGLADQQAALADNRAVVDELSRSLKRAQDAIKGFAGTNISGTKGFEDQLFALDQQAAAVKLQLNTLMIGGATKKDPALVALQAQLDAINLQAENVNLTKQLQLDPLRKQVSDLASTTKELSFDAIVQGIKAAQGQEGDLTKKLADANGAFVAQQAAVDAAQQALVAATAARDGEKASIDASKEALIGLNAQLVALKATQAPKELTDQLAALQDRASQVNLTERLQLDPLRKQISDLVNTTKELTFADIVNGIKDAQGQESDLTKRLASATGAYSAQQSVVDAAQQSLAAATAARDKEKASIDASKDALTGLNAQLVALKAVQAPKELTDQLANLQDRATQLKLADRLELEPLRRQIALLLNPIKEMSFAEIVGGIESTRRTIATLEGEVASSTIAWEAEKAALIPLEASLKSAEQARDAHTKVIEGEKAALAALKGALDDNRAGYAGAKDELDKFDAALKDASTVPQGLTDALLALQNQADMLKLSERVQFDPLRKQIEDLAHPAKELTFAEITNGIRAAQAEMAAIDPQIAAVTAAIAAQKTMVEGATAAHDAATAKLAAERDTLDTLKQRYADITGQIQAWEQSLTRVTSAASGATQAAKAAADAGTGVPGAPKPTLDPGMLDEQKKQLQDMRDQYDKTKKEIEDRVNLWKDRLTTAYRKVLDVIVPVKDAVGALLKAFQTGDFNSAFGPLLAALDAVFGPGTSGKVALTVSNILSGLQRFRDFVIADVLPALRQFGDWFLAVGLPAIQAFAAAVLPIVQQVAGFIQRNFATIVTVVGVALTAFVAFQAISAVVGVVMAVVGAIQVLIAAASVIAFVLGSGGGVAGALGFIVAVLGGPVTVAIGAVALIVALFAAAWVNNWGDIQGKVAAVWAWLQPVLADLGARLAQFWTDILPQLAAAWDSVSTKVVAAAQWLWGGIQAVFGAVAGFLAAHGDQIKNILSGAWDVISTYINTVIRIVSDVIQAVLLLIAGDWSGAWDKIKDILAAAWDYIKVVVAQGGDLVKNLLAALWGVVQAAAGAAWQWVQDRVAAAWDAIRATVGGAFSDLGARVRGGLDGIKADWDAAWAAALARVTGWAGDLLSSVGTFIGTTLPQKFRDGLSNVTAGFMAVFEGAGAVGASVARWLADRLGDAGRFIGTDLPQRFRDGLSNVTAGFMAVFTGAGAVGASVARWLSDRLDDARDFIGTDLPQRFRDGLSNVTAGFMAVFTGSGAVGASVARWLSDRIADIGTWIGVTLPQKFRDGLSNVTSGFMAIFEGAGAVGESVRTWLGDRIADIGTWIGTTLPDKFRDGLSNVTAGFMAVFTGAGAAGEAVARWLSDRLGDIGTWIGVTLPQKFRDGVSNVTSGFMAVFTGAGAVGESVARWLSDRLTDVGTWIGTTLPQKFRDGQQAVRDKFMGVFEGVGSVGTALGTWFTGTTDAASTFITMTLPAKFTGAIDTVKDAFMGIFTKILTPGSGGVLFDWFTQAVSAVDTFIATHIPGKFTEKYDAVRAAFMGIWSNFLDAAGKGTLATWFTDTATSIGTYIGTTIPAKIALFASDIETAIKAPFSGAAGALNTIFTGMVNTVIKGVNAAGAKVAAFANGIRGVINWISQKLGAGDAMPDVYTWTDGVQITALAQGTDSWRGGPALVGEAGRELVRARGDWQLVEQPALLHLARGATVIPNDQTEALLAAGIPGFAGGLNLGGLGDIFDVLKKGAGWLYDQAKGATGLADPTLPGALGAIGPAIAGKAKGWALGFIDKLLKAATPAPASSGGGAYAFPIQGFRGSFEQSHWGSGDPLARGGADIFAPVGTPLVAMQDSTLSVSSGSLGGNMAYMTDASGLNYYYAHLNSFSRGDGPVRKGEQVGTLGQTGNAAGTSPHLHIGIGYGITSSPEYQGVLSGLGKNFDAIALLDQAYQDSIAPAPAPRSTFGQGPSAGGTGGNWGDPSIGDLDNYIGGGRALSGWGDLIKGDSADRGVPANLAMTIFGHESQYGDPGDGLAKYKNFGGLTGTGWGGQIGSTRPGEFNNGNPIQFAIFDSKQHGIDAVLDNLGHYKGLSLRQTLAKWLTGDPSGTLDSGGFTVADYLAYARQTIGALGGRYDPDALRFADGGVITEPIVGRGQRSGRSYTFGENGKEGVFNADQLAALSPRGAGDGGEVHYHYTIESTEPTVTIDGLKREQRREERLRGYGR